MFHRLPYFLATAAALAVVAFLLSAVSPTFTPETAHASHGGSLPQVSIVDITPEVGEEGGRLRVTVQLSRPLTADETWCYPSKEGAQPYDYACIQGGIMVYDSYNDHRPGELNDQGNPHSDFWRKFVIIGGETEERLSIGIEDDKCITPDRTIRIRINPIFRSEKYGYTIDATEHTVRVAGNDEENGKTVDDGGKCLAVDEGATEDIPRNYAPRFGTRPLERSVDENTESGEDIGSPVTADDEENDTLEYSLTGADASHFDIDSSTGQILTDGDLDYETKDTYHLAVAGHRRQGHIRRFRLGDRRQHRRHHHRQRR